MNKLLIRTLLLTLTIFTVACGDSAEKAKDYTENGKRLFAEGDLTKAKLEFKNAIQVDNKMVDAYYHLALIDEQDRNWRSMVANLSWAIKIDPTNAKARLKLGRLYLLSKQLDLATSEADDVLKTSPENADAMALKAAVLVKQKRKSEALVLIDQALAIDPDNMDGVTLRAITYLDEGNFTSALDVVNKALAVKPKEVTLNLLKIQIHGKQPDVQAVIQDYQRLIEYYPENIDYQFMLAKYYVDLGQRDKAEQHLQSVIANNPDKIQAKLLFVNFITEQDVNKAESIVRSYIKQEPEKPQFYYMLSKLLIKQKKFDEAKQPLESLIENHADQKEGQAALNIMAKFDAQDGNYEQALKKIERVLDADKNNLEAMLLKSKIILKKDGDVDKGIVELRNIIRDYPEEDEAYVLLAKAYLKQKSPGLAEENFRKAIEINPGNYNGVLPVVSKMIKRKDYGRAETLLNKHLKVKPANPSALALLADIRLENKNWSGIQDVVTQVEKNPEGAGYAKFLGGEVSKGQGDCQSALTQYQQALDYTPSLFKALEGLAYCNEKLDKRQDTYRYLETFIKDNPDNLYPLIIKSKLLAAEKKWDGALTIVNQLIAKKPEVAEFYDAKSQLFLKQKQQLSAIETLKTGLEQIPNSAMLMIKLATIHDQLGQFDEELALYETLVEKYPDYEVGINNLASLLLDKFPNKANFERARDLSKRFNASLQPFYLDTYGWARLKAGAPDKALSVLQKVVDYEPRIPVFHYHLAHAYKATDQNQEAISSLEKAINIGQKMGSFTEMNDAQKLLQELKTVPAG